MKKETILKHSALYHWQNKHIQQEVSLFSYLENPNLVINPWTGHQSALLEGNTDVAGKYPRPTVVYKLRLNIDASSFNRLRVKMYIDAPLYPCFYIHVSILSNSGFIDDAPSVAPNKEEEIIWELKDIDLTNLKEIKVNIFMMGTPPKANPNIKIYLEDVILDQVELDPDFGWEANGISYSQIGYLLNAKKEAIVKWMPNTSYQLLSDNKVFKESPLQKITFQNQDFGLIDFSDVSKKGKYTLKVGKQKTPVFEISEDIYTSSIEKSLAFLKALNCGKEVKGIHPKSHLNCYTINEEGERVPNYGGWYDAGDVSQFEICTAEMAYAILELAEVESDPSLKNKLLKEAKVGIDWLLQTRLSDGKRALAVTYHIWRNNEENPNDPTLACKAEEGPFEDYLASMALAKAALVYQDNQAYAKKCLKMAIADYDHATYCYNEGIYTKRWGPTIDALASGAACSALSLLYKLTSDEKYLSDATKYSRILLNCQEQTGVEGVKGFFYEDQLHEYVLTFEHRGHEQTPIQGLVDLCHTFKDHPMYEKWLQGVKLYASYIKDTYIDNPYGLMSAQIYLLSKMRDDRFTVPSWYCTKEEAHDGLRRQVRSGKKLSEDAYLRMFPIAIQRRGFHATLLSKTKGIAMCANLLDDEALKEITLKQIEWVMGKNPFSTSTMYGLGFNYHPLYVAFTPQLLGALPVGIMTKGDSDAPYWPQATQAVYKEVWGHTTGKYLSILAEIKGGLK